VWYKEISAQLLKKPFLLDYLDKDIKVSPSTSTTSNISSSSSSSGESIATIDMQGGHHHNIRSPVISTSSSTSHLHHVGLYYNEVDQQEDKQPFYQPKITNKPLPTVSKSSIIPVAAVDPTKKRRRGNLPKEVTEFLRKWLIQHKKHPYPAEKEKADLARHTGLTVNQISNWFINARRRILQPMLESENLTAQMMAYPDHLAPVNGTSAGASSLSSSSFEPPRRRRHDFYSYQRDFGSSASPPPPPPMHHHHHQEPSSYNQHHQHHYLHSPPPIEEDDNNQRFIFRTTRLVETNDHYNQIPMR
jgi:hypothetical protein